MIRSLVAKELQQHGLALGWASLLLAALLTADLSFALIQQSNTLLTAATGFAYYGMPFAVALVVRRLVILEHEQGTHDFVAALPVPAIVRVGVPWLLGLFWVQLATLSALVAIALLVHRQELIAPGWLAQLAAQCSAVVFGWYGLTFAAAHLGRFRFSLWLVVLAVVFTLDDLYPDVWSWGLWHAALADPVDVTRYAVPWRGLLVSTAWGVAGSAVGVFLGVWRSGAVTAGWFQPMTRWERTALVVGVLFVWVAGDIATLVVVPGGPAFEALPAVRPGPVVVRVAASEGGPLWGTGEGLATALGDLEEATGIGGWPAVILVESPQAEQTVEIRVEAHGELVLAVDAAATPRRQLTEALRTVLAARAAWYPELRGDHRWVVLGAPPWWLGPDPERPSALDALAAQGRAAGLAVGDLADGHRLVARVGEDVAAAVAWRGLTLLEAEAGRDAVLALLRWHLDRRWQQHTLGSLAVALTRPDRQLARVGGREAGAFREDWLRALPVPSEPVPRWGSLRRELADDGAVRLHWRWEGAVPEGVSLRWIRLDPLEGRPPPRARFEEEPLTGSEGMLPVGIGPRERLAATFSRRIDGWDASLISGMEVLE